MENSINNKIIRTAIYIRVSTEEQVRHGYSLEAQKERLKNFCKEKGYKVIDVYADEGKTARTKLKNRKELLRLIDDVRRKEIDRIVFWRLDRWFRNVSDYYKIQNILDENHVEWECSDEEYNTTTSNGRLHLNIKLSIAQNESDQTSDRIKFNFNLMIKNGNVIVGNQGMPLGYIISGEKKNKKMIKDPDTEQIATDMWDNIQLTGSIRQTLIYINNKYNLSICYDSMRHYLMNEKYYGTYRGVENYCPAYVTKDVFENVQSIIKRNIKMNKRHDYIFSGLLKCPICKHKLAGFTVKATKSHGKKVEFRYPSYRCNYKYQGRCTYNKRPVEKTVEKYLLNNIEDEINKYKVEIDNIKESKEQKPKIDIDKLKKRLERLTDLYLDEKIDRNKYNEEYDKIKEQLAEVEAEERKKETSKSNYSKLEKLFNKDTLHLYNSLSSQNKRMFWSNFIEYIEIDLNNEYHIHFKK